MTAILRGGSTAVLLLGLTTAGCSSQAVETVGDPPRVVIGERAGVARVAVGDDAVFWLEADRLFAIPLGSGQEVLGPPAELAGEVCGSGLVAHGRDAFVATCAPLPALTQVGLDHSVRRYPLPDEPYQQAASHRITAWTSCAGEVGAIKIDFAASQVQAHQRACPYAIVASDTEVAFAELRPGQPGYGWFHAVLDTGGVLAPLATDGLDLWAADPQGFWGTRAAGGGIYRLEGGLAREVVAGGDGLVVVAAQAAGDTLYWLEAPADGRAGQGELWRVTSDGAAALLATALTRPTSLAVDDHFVYWADPTEGQILRVPR